MERPGLKRLLTDKYNDQDGPSAGAEAISTECNATAPNGPATQPEAKTGSDDWDPAWEADYAAIIPLIPPGIDPKIVREQFEQIFTCLKPEGVVNRMLVRDLVIQTNLADFVLGSLGPV